MNLLRRFWYWLKPYKVTAACFDCGTSKNLMASADGLFACPPCAERAIRSFTNREQRRTAKRNLKREKR